MVSSGGTIPAAAPNSTDKFGYDRVWDGERVVVVFDHHVPPGDEEIATQQAEITKWVTEMGVDHFYRGGSGISHNVLAEEGFALPGQVLVGADSHTVTLGAFGTYATGIGHTDLGNVLGTGNLWLRVPESIRIEVENQLVPPVAPKDLALKIMGELTAQGGIYKSIEYHGEGVRNLSMDGRQTLTNLSVELGAAAGIVPPDETTRNYLENRAIEDYNGVVPDEDANYDDEYRIDAEAIEPLVAEPSQVDNVTPVRDVAGTDVDQVFLGTCNNGRIEDIQSFATFLEGEQIDPGVDLIVVPGSKSVAKQMSQTGLNETLLDAGAMIETPGCGPCFGAHSGVLGRGETCLGTMNRNFPGRMGPGEIYLGSPETAAVTALYGVITDPREAV